jgi:hypothetical protein
VAHAARRRDAGRARRRAIGDVGEAARRNEHAAIAERWTRLTELGGGMFPPRMMEALTQRYGIK